MPLSKREMKEFLGRLPYLAEAYWRILYRGKPLHKKASLQHLRQQIPHWKAQEQLIRADSSCCRTRSLRIALFSSYKLWIQHSALLAIGLASCGHRVTLAFMPYVTWRRRIDPFALRMQNAYLKDVLNPLAPNVNVVSLFDIRQRMVRANLPSTLEAEIEALSIRDTQYTLQIERFEPHDMTSEAGRLYALRRERNHLTARTAYQWLNEQKPDLILIPNGSILEFGAVYQVAKFIGIPAITYEFGEQRQRIWLAINDEVMLQNTDAVWQAHVSQPLQDDQKKRLAALFQARSQADLWENFSRRWQGVSRQGAEFVRQQLELGDKPTFLLATNVIGDSLTLNRQIFSRSMTEWIERTIRFFAEHPDTQLIIRIHPGERYTRGPSVKDIVSSIFPSLPGHFRLVSAEDDMNTYDLMEIAHYGLVYTTTTGLEMAMVGLPTIVAGRTHYRNKGFTLDPGSWDEYIEILEKAIADPQSYRLSPEQIEKAWHYAYVFFFEYPLPFPWHLHMKDDHEQWPLHKVFSEEGVRVFGPAFSILCGESMN